ncbi:hypothetical protein H2200_000137 [Cladophialophora chaetospira]|uniref:Xylanolytic transcriptional activator regulatory domain-containing protein n=1 Tax=Cladophialophora chaetospira TaxID=386627 RepID=A0AA39CNX6_9EURO|nr:hypothetical protein H2200_000137 [Cladophialophora chaetospira]
MASPASKYCNIVLGGLKCRVHDDKDTGINSHHSRKRDAGPFMTAKSLGRARLSENTANSKAGTLSFLHEYNFEPRQHPAAAASSPRVDEFYNSSYLSRRAVLGDDFPDIDHSHGSRRPHEHTLTESDMKVLELYNAFELPPIPARQALFETFYERCFTWMPVVDDKSASTESSRAATSLLVLQAVLLVAATTKPESNPMLPPYPQYRRVKALIDTCAERNPLNLLAALCLMQFYAPAAPKDISTDHPRFWGTYALGLALQMGLNMKTTNQNGQEGLKRRIWWTLYARDSMMSSAHGRARIVNPSDCSIDPPSIYDFPDPNDPRAQVFVSYVSITSILADLCQLLTRQKDPPPAEKNKIGLRLVEYVRRLPPALRLVQPNGVSKPYSLDLAQLHIHILTTIIIFYRPQSIFHVPPTSAPAIVASNLNFRIFEAIELRGHTCYVSSGCAWHLLVTAIPQLSCLAIPNLRGECKSNLDTLEGVFRTLGSTRPSARNNLRNIQVIRKALESKNALPTTRQNIDEAANAFSFSPLDLFDPYGVDVPGSYDRIVAALESFSVETSQNGQTNSSATQGNDNLPHTFGAEAQSFAPTPNNEGDVTMFDDFPELLGSNFPEDGWMRNWINELNLFTE